jgi:N-acetylglucosamine kinase-like BadF-type ATPase
VPLFLGIDSGGTKTACVLGDERTILGRGLSGASNVVRVGEAQAKQALAEAVQEACRAAGRLPREIVRTVMGSAGAARAEARKFLEQTLAELIAGEVRVVGDMIAAMHAAFGDRPGVVVISGTGSIAYGRNEQGETARAGGWGWAISDEGSGPWIGRAAVAAIFHAHQQGRVSALESAVLHAWQLADTEQLVRAANATPPPDFGGLLPEVQRAAAAGDPAAQEVVARAGRELAQLARTVATRLFPENNSVPVAMAGGVFCHAPLVRDAFRHALLEVLPQSVVLSALAEPVLGALALARQGQA